MNLKRSMVLVAFCEGMLSGSHHWVFYFIYTRHFKMHLLTFQILHSILTIIVCLNPIFGYVSDHFTLFGSKRKSYLIILSFLGAVGYTVCGLLFYFKIPVGVIMAMNFLIDAVNSFRHVINDSICVINHNIGKFKLKAMQNVSSNSSVSVLFAARLFGKILSIIMLGTVYDYLQQRCVLKRLLLDGFCFACIRNNRFLPERAFIQSSA